MVDARDGHLYLLVLTTVRLIPPGLVVDAIPLDSLGALGHTRDSASQRLADPDFWDAGPEQGAAVVGELDSHEAFAVNHAKVDAVRACYQAGRATDGDVAPRTPRREPPVMPLTAAAGTVDVAPTTSTLARDLPVPASSAPTSTASPPPSGPSTGSRRTTVMHASRATSRPK